jgi:pseudaminic acid cytidylyltransferase
VRCLAIITARGGSKRIPRKNIRPFHGKPVIAYSISTALESKLFTEVMVSTDDNEIAGIAAGYGATVPFSRSPETAGDYATTADVLLEVLTQYKIQGKAFQYACCLYPTAPFITAARLQHAFEQLQQQDADVVFPVVKYSASIWRSLRMEGNGRVSSNWPEHSQKRSQDLPDAYYDCGQFYFFSVDRFLEKKTLYTGNTIGLPVDEMEVQDIDSEADWKMAEFKFAYINQTIKYTTNDANI